MKLDTVRQHALSLPDVTEQPHHHYASFRIAGKIFLTVPPQEDAIHVFVDEQTREHALALYPGWAMKLLWGGKVRGLRIELRHAEATVVKRLIRSAYDAKAGASRSSMS